jgi:serine protease Do
LVRESLLKVAESGGDIQAGWLGIFSDWDQDEILVSDVIPKSPAEAAGLEPGDVILEIERRAIEEARQLARVLRWSGPGGKIELTVDRQGALKHLPVRLGSYPLEYKPDYTWAIEVPKVWQPEKPGGESERVRLYQVPVPPPAKLGVFVEAMSPQLAEFFKAPPDHGLLITSVAEESTAKEIGLQAGDVLLELNQVQLRSSADVTSVLGQVKDGILKLKYLRDGKVQNEKVVLH